MAQDVYEKTVLFFDLHRFSTVRGVSNGSGPVRYLCQYTVGDLVGFWRSLLGADLAHKTYLKNKLELYLVDIQENNDYFYLLVNCTNATGAHHSSRDISSGQTQDLTYQPAEGPNSSSHIIIKKRVENNRNLVVVERSNGITIVRLISFLNKLTANYINSGKAVKNGFKVDHPLGERNSKGELKRPVKKPVVELHGYISERFYQDLNNGFVDEIVLLSGMKKVAGMDHEPPPEFKTWEVGVDRAPLATNSAIDYIGRVLERGREFDMEKLRVRFRDGSGATHTKKINVEDSSLAESDYYVLTRRISFSFRPRLAYNSIRAAFTTRMERLIEDEEL
ncbi:hypothetical protein [Halomonas salinarum]|uniref:hypothetical protein n=1 Tax=Halomonas salinarum TaxID=1158993 RepID=UPI00143C3D28|nr:hypothetical protein [Halomonas salinarum]